MFLYSRKPSGESLFAPENDENNTRTGISPIFSVNSPLTQLSQRRSCFFLLPKQTQAPDLLCFRCILPRVGGLGLAVGGLHLHCAEGLQIGIIRQAMRPSPQNSCLPLSCGGGTRSSPPWRGCTSSCQLHPRPSSQRSSPELLARMDSSGRDLETAEWISRRCTWRRMHVQTQVGKRGPRETNRH